ncbi:MAG: acetyl-CoA carboxylase biotin carboxyl carrier protein subunit [Rhodospirillales bacterium]
MSDAKKHDIDEAVIRRLAELLDEIGVTEIEYGGADWHVRVAKGARAIAAPVAPASASVAPGGGGAPASASAGIAPDHPGLVKSPMVGLAYLTEKPGEPPLVKVGDPVKEGQTLLLIEAMKVFNPIKAPKAGTIGQIFVKNEAPVEFGEPLLIIE